MFSRMESAGRERRVQICTLDPPPVQMYQKIPVSPAMRALVTPSTATSVPREHHTLTTHPANGDWGDGHRFHHPATRCCFTVCKSIGGLSANPSDVIKQTFPDKTGTGLQSSPLGDSSARGSGGSGCWERGAGTEYTVLQDSSIFLPFPHPLNFSSPSHHIKASISYKALWRPQLINPPCNWSVRKGGQLTSRLLPAAQRGSPLDSPPHGAGTGCTAPSKRNGVPGEVQVGDTHLHQPREAQTPAFCC